MGQALTRIGRFLVLLSTLSALCASAPGHAGAPLGGDYTLYGGLYRSVRLVSTPDLHLDMLDHGSSGVEFRADEVSAASARLHWTVRVANERARPVRASVTARLRDASGKTAATV